MKSYPKDQKDKVMKKLMELSSQTDVPVGALSQLAKEEGIPKATIYPWNHNLKVAKQRQAIEENSTAKGWTSQAKFQAVLATSTMSELQLGEYLRSNGILKEELDNWRATCQNANDLGAESASKYRSALASEKTRSKKLEAELSRKEKALAETAALLVLRGKARQFGGTKRSNDLSLRSPKCSLAN